MALCVLLKEYSFEVVMNFGKPTKACHLYQDFKIRNNLKSC